MALDPLRTHFWFKTHPPVLYAKIMTYENNRLAYATRLTPLYPSVQNGWPLIVIAFIFRNLSPVLIFRRLIVKQHGTRVDLFAYGCNTFISVISSTTKNTCILKLKLVWWWRQKKTPEAWPLWVRVQLKTVTNDVNLCTVWLNEYTHWFSQFFRSQNPGVVTELIGFFWNTSLRSNCKQRLISSTFRRQN